VSRTLPTPPCPAGASGRPEPPKSSEVALDCDSVGGEGRSPPSLSTPFCLPGLSGNGPNRDARPGELPRPFFAFLSGCFVAQNCGQVDTWIRGLTYGFGLDFAPWPTSPLGRRLPRWGLRASRSSSAAVSASWLSKRVSSPGRPATGGRRRATRGPRRCTSSARRRADPESGTIKQFFDGSVPSPAQDLLHRAKSAQPQTDDCRFL